MDSIALYSRAKVNIGLLVLNHREDGYHNLYTIFQELDYHDTITLTKTKSGFELSSDDEHFPVDRSNTCSKAYEAILGQFPNIG
ncbi:MAG: 4-(cytidine 5'-diphospho)-2-C-methyl-D-erythritol kinase, partial [Candidatus Poribacteria bacterium]|nr:4-(cytidine 5'-diphospho)-2-C-methyl-D-erythritol kinase [Candidatus Poribacteria bacterium]